jgi:hypothetical protein
MGSSPRRFIPALTNVQVLVSGNRSVAIEQCARCGSQSGRRGYRLLRRAADKLNYQLIARSDIKSIEQLKGKKFAVSRYGSSADFGMRAMPSASASIR